MEGSEEAAGGAKRPAELEVRALQLEVVRLQAERDALVRALADRDFERPPHWEGR